MLPDPKGFRLEIILRLFEYDSEPLDIHLA